MLLDLGNRLCGSVYGFFSSSYSDGDKIVIRIDTKLIETVQRESEMLQKAWPSLGMCWGKPVTPHEVSNNPKVSPLSSSGKDLPKLPTLPGMQHSKPVRPHSPGVLQPEDSGHHQDTPWLL